MYNFRTLAAISVAYGAIKLVPAMVGFLGFEPSGVVGGSLAAWIISFHCGLVPAGGLVATLQSIGSAGLGVVGSMLVGTVGAVAGVLGFGPNGVVSGSLAAWITSLQSTPVPAGGIMATLQSIGAAGLGIFSNIFVGTVGAVGQIAGYIAAAFA